MKKKLLAVLAVAGMMAFTITGCNNEATGDPTGGDVSSAAEETQYMFSLQAKGTDDATLVITYADGTVEEVGSQGWFGNGTQTLAEAMEEWEIVSIDAKCGDAPFLGWIGYEVITQVDANGFEESVEKPLIMSKLYYSTEDLMNEILPEQDIVYYTAFEFECGGCEEKKACDVYYIDDDVYYVCIDCYEEFATGMGLIDAPTGDDASTDTSAATDTSNETSSKNDTSALQVCSGCQVEKKCGTYNVDGKDYIVCDDCYEEFATGMGLLELQVCSGCEVEKECGTYTVDGVDYVVCDDCYEEFATGMGLN